MLFFLQQRGTNDIGCLPNIVAVFEEFFEFFPGQSREDREATRKNYWYVLQTIRKNREIQTYNSMIFIHSLFFFQGYHHALPIEHQVNKQQCGPRRCGLPCGVGKEVHDQGWQEKLGLNCMVWLDHRVYLEFCEFVN